MSDIRKNLILSAKLDDAQLRKQFEILKKEMGKTFSVDGGSLNDLKASIKDIAKEFGVQLKKELEGIRGQKGKMQGQASSNKIDMSNITSIQVKEMQVANMVVNSLTFKNGSGDNSGSSGPSGNGGDSSDENNGRGNRRNKTLLKIGAAGLALQQGVSSIINIQQTLAERNNRFSRDLDAGHGVEGIAREAGRSRFGMAVAGGAGGALAGGALGAKIGGGIGTFLGGPAGTGVGGAIGAGIGGIVGGVSSYLGTSNAVGELSKEQVQLLSDAEQRARSISPLRQQMMAGGGTSRGTMTDQMRMGSRQYGMSPEDTLQSMLQARETLGNKGASESFNQIMGNQRFLGISAGTTANSIETMAGASGESRSMMASKQSEIIKKGVAAGLDVSKSGRFLQTTAQYLQATVGFGRTDVDSATSRLANLASGFGGGQVTDTSLTQAQSLAQMLQGESSSIQGLSGAANLNQVQGISSKYGGFGTGTSLALAGMSSNAKGEDILSVLSEGQRTGEVGKNVDLASAVKDLQAAKQQDSTMALMQQVAGGNNNLALGAMGAESNFQGNFSTESLLGRQRAGQGNISGGMMSAQEAIESAKSDVQKSPEFQLDVAQFTRNAESAGKGLETFTSVTEQMTNQMKKLLSDLEAAQKRFQDMSRATGYSGIKR